jgi:NTE family protein
VNSLKNILLLIILSTGFFCYSQNNTIRNLVFEGAGIRGVAYSGTVKELEAQNILKGIQRVGGTSSGAITALLISIGYSASEIATIVSTTPYKKFNDGRFFFFGGINRLRNYFGWYRGEEFEKWLSKLIRLKLGDDNITFQQLKQKGCLDLYVTGTCLNQQSLIIFSFENYPNMKVKDAVRISMSIPMYFEAVFIDSIGNIVHHPKNKNDLNIMVDGGFTANFPIKIFDSTKYFDETKPNSFAPNRQTIGFRIDRTYQIYNDSSGKSLAPFEINSLKNYLGAFYNIIVENLNRQTLTKDDWERTVSISDGNVAPRVKQLSKQELTVMIHNGETATQHFLLKKHQLH